MQLGARFVRTSNRTNRGFTTVPGMNQLSHSDVFMALTYSRQKMHHAPCNAVAVCRDTNMQQVLHFWHHLATTAKLAQDLDASQSTACQHTRVCRLACSFPVDYAIFVTYHEPGNRTPGLLPTSASCVCPTSGLYSYTSMPSQAAILENSAGHMAVPSAFAGCTCVSARQHLLSERPEQSRQ